MLLHMGAFSPDNVKEGLVIIVCDLFRSEIAVRIIFGAFPAAIDAHLCALLYMPVMKGTCLYIASGRPLNMREVYRIFMRIDFYRLGLGIGRINMICKAAWVYSPAICLCLAFDNPFRHQLASPASLYDAKGKYTGFKGIFNARHRPDKRQSIWRVGNRAIYNTGDTCCAKYRHTCTGIFNIPFQPFQIIGIKLEGKIFWHLVICAHPVGFTVFLIWPQ